MSGTWWAAPALTARAYDVKEQVEQMAVRLLEEYEGHPSLRTLVNDGYAVITF